MNAQKKSSSFICAIFGAILIPVFTPAEPLDNWRLPYYLLGSRLGYVSSSPSSMFWDDLKQPAGQFLDKSMWPDSDRVAENHWMLEPAGATALLNTNDFYGKNYALAGSLLNDIRFRGFLARQVVDVNTKYVDDPGYVWIKNRGAGARLSEAYLQYDFDYGFLRMGRLNRNWGPFADRSLILSANPYSYDGVELGLHSSVFEFRHLFAAFPQYAMNFDGDTTGAARYLTAHSLNFMLGRFGTVGITESVVFGRRNGIPDLQYVNPISVYFVTNTIGEGTGNLMEAVQWDLHPFTDKVSLLGQFLIDDIQVDNKDSGDLKPNMWATDLGVLWNDFLPLRLPHVLSLEYRFVSRWTYTVSDANTASGERYTYLGSGLGSPSDDCDSLSLSFAMAGRNFWLGSLGFSYSRRGQNRLSTKWNDSVKFPNWPDILGYRNEPQFPSGTVENTFDACLQVGGYYKNFIDARFALHNRWIQNRDNVSSPLTYDPTIALLLGLHYSNFFIGLPK